MNLKRTFGFILTLLGIAGMIYTAVVFSRSSTDNSSIKELVIYGVLGVIFFASGIGLIKNTKDEA